MQVATPHRPIVADPPKEPRWTDWTMVGVTEVLPGLHRQPASGRGRGRGEALTPREREVALLLVSGATDKQIAAALTITEGTAGLHVHRVLTKLGLRSRVQVADRAFDVGLTTI